MKRYTLTFTPKDQSVTATELKDELEHVLLRLHPRITYQIRQVYTDKSGLIQAEIRADGKRDLLESTIISREWRLPLQFERMGWGWLSDNNDALLNMGNSYTLDTDPLADFGPAPGIKAYIPSTWRLRIRYFALILSTMLLIFLLILNAIYTHTPWLEGIYFAVIFIWSVSFHDTPFDFRIYATKITCGIDSLEVNHWLGRKLSHMEWKDVWGMDYVNPTCVVFSSPRKIRFLVSERFGCKVKAEVLKTIASRAGLNYVEGNFQKLIYRKYDAPESDQGAIQPQVD